MLIGIPKKIILFYFLSIAAPVLTLAQPTLTFSPANGATAVNESTTITISSSQALRIDAGNVTLDNTNVDDVLTLKLTDASGGDIPFTATINGGKDFITITPGSSLPSNAVIYVAIAGVETTTGGGQNIDPDPTWITFTVRDYEPPVTTFSPADGTSNLAITTNPIITFDEPVRNIDDSEITNANVSTLLTFKLDNSGGTDVPYSATINPAKTQITIVPTASLANGQAYYVSLAPVEDASDNAAATESITFTTTTDVQAPVASFDPANGATDVDNTNAITITFDEAIRDLDNSPFDDTSIDGKITLKLTDASGADIPFDASIDGSETVITITPSSILPDFTQVYVAINNVEDEFDNAVTTPLSATFTSGDGTPPVATFSPMDGSVGIAVTTNITITFDEEIRNTNDSEITAANVASLLTFKLTNSSGADVPFTASIDATKTIITIDPDPDLNSDQQYYVGVAAVENSYDRATTPSSITFTTIDTQPPVPTFDPADGATGVSNTANIEITFNEPIRNLNNAVLDNTTIDGKITLKLINSAGANIPFDATIDASKTVVTINPAATLPDLTTIYVAISGVEDQFDNAISLQSITFTTTDGTPPVITFDPADGSSTLQITANITITFNEPIRHLNGNVISNTSVDGLITFKLNNSGGSNVGFNASIDASKTVITIDPDNNLVADQVYYLSIDPVEDAYDNHTSSASITFETQELTINITSDKTTLCAGESATLTANVSGGNGFYSIAWTSDPPGFTSSNQTVTVSPTVTRTYYCAVTDSDGNTNSGTPASRTITVNQNEPATNLEIQLNPSKPNNTYQNTDAAVDLAYTINGLPGTFSGNTRFEGIGVNSTNNKFYPTAANLGTNNIILNYENASGCITQKSVSVEVRDQNAFITGLDPQYCEEDQNVNLVINQEIYYPPTLRFHYNPITGFFELTPVKGYRYTYQGDAKFFDYYSGVQIGAPGFSFSGNNIVLNTHYTGSNYKYFYIYYQVQEYEYNSLDPANPTPLGLPRNEYVQVLVRVLPRPQLFHFIPSALCENNPAITLDVSPSGGTFTLNGSPGSPTFDPGTNGLPDNNTITYTYTDPSTSCSNSFEHTISINRLPGLAIDVNDGCINELIPITPVFNNPDNIDFNYFFDTDGLAGYETTVASNIPATIERTYTVPSNYPIRLQVKTDAGCTEEVTESLTIGQVPDLQLVWSNVCDGDPTRFAIRSNFYKNNITDVASIDWDFGDGNTVFTNSPAYSDSVYQHLYNTTGYYTANVTLTTDLNCSNTQTAVVYKVAKSGPVGATEYLEDFNKVNFEEQAWKSGGENSSWAWGEPAGTLISNDGSGGGKAWVTNLSGTYNINEDSWVHSGCIDLTQIERPVLTFDFRSLTRDGVDGVVLQYNTKNTTHRESDWKTLGNVSSGKNWYNKIGIGANPGNQALLQTGWTGSLDSSTWRSAIIALDNMLTSIPPAERERVRFRFAFGSADFVPDGEGFAFDNFKISQRDRIVLIEQFTNNGGPNSPSEPNKVSNTAINNFLSSSTGEAIKLEYHLGISGPGVDPIYESNRIDANSRAAFYGVTTTPTSLVDSRVGVLANIFTEQTLRDSEVTINTIETTNSPAHMFNVSATFTAKRDLPPNTVLHIAVIEKQVNVTSALGSNGENMFTYVMRKMLPDATGTRFGESILKDESRTVSYSWSPKAFDLDQLAVIVFVQNEDTKEIYQTGILENPVHIPPAELITDTELDLVSQIHVYPNPADREINLFLPIQAREAIGIKLIDSFGRAIYNAAFNKGAQTNVIPTQDLSGGMYILQLETKEGLVRRKVMVVHE